MFLAACFYKSYTNISFEIKLSNFLAKDFGCQVVYTGSCAFSKVFRQFNQSIDIGMFSDVRTG